jgi:hypothetical protein
MIKLWIIEKKKKGWLINLPIQIMINN